LLVRHQLLLRLALRRRDVVRLQPREVRQRPGGAAVADLGAAEHAAGVPPGEVGRLQDQGLSLPGAGNGLSRSRGRAGVRRGRRDRIPGWSGLRDVAPATRSVEDNIMPTAFALPPLLAGCGDYVKFGITPSP